MPQQSREILQIMYELERMLCEITGMDYFTLQPAAGAHGEFLGMLLTRAIMSLTRIIKETKSYYLIHLMEQIQLVLRWLVIN